MRQFLDVIGSEMRSNKFIVEIRVIATGKHWFIIGDKADRMLRKFRLFDSQKRK